MTNPNAPLVPKWPFFLGDVLLLGVAWWIASASPAPFAAWPLLVTFGCVAAGACLAVWPFIADHRASLQLAESGVLNDAVRRIQQLDGISRQIGDATGRWQDVQGQAAATAQLAHDMTDRMANEAKAFAEFMHKANDTERQHMRLEIEKLRRGEGEWLQLLVALLDNVFALHRAGVRSQKKALIDQLSHFQHICRDVVRRVGLVAVEANPGDAFDPARHQLAEPNAPLSSPATVQEILAPGYTFQGRSLRLPVVALQAEPPLPSDADADVELSSIPEPETETPAPAETASAQSADLLHSAGSESVQPIAAPNPAAATRPATPQSPPLDAPEPALAASSAKSGSKPDTSRFRNRPAQPPNRPATAELFPLEDERPEPSTQRTPPGPEGSAGPATQPF